MVDLNHQQSCPIPLVKLEKTNPIKPDNTEYLVSSLFPEEGWAGGSWLRSRLMAAPSRSHSFSLTVRERLGRRVNSSLRYNKVEELSLARLLSQVKSRMFVFYYTARP